MDFSDVDECFERYKYWRNGEEIMEGHWARGTALKLRLDLLKNMKRVQTANQRGLKIIRGSRRGDPPYSYTRREIESCLKDDYSCSSDYEVHIELFTIAQESCGVSIPCLALDSIWELVKKDLGTRIWPTLRQLKINLLSLLDIYLHWPISWDPSQYRTPASWVSSLFQLEELAIIGPDIDRSFDIFDLLSTVMFPSLKIINLQGVPIRYATFTRFFTKHRKTLLHLSICDSLMIYEQQHYSEVQQDVPSTETYDSSIDSDDSSTETEDSDLQTSRSCRTNLPEEEEEEEDLMQKQSDWDMTRTLIQAMAEEMGVTCDLSHEIMTTRKMMKNPRYKLYIAF